MGNDVRCVKVSPEGIYLAKWRIEGEKMGDYLRIVRTLKRWSSR